MGYYPAVHGLMGRDGEFLASLTGKSKDEVCKWFPDLRTVDGANSDQAYYREQMLGRDFLWIGDSWHAIEFEGGRVKDVGLWKG